MALTYQDIFGLRTLNGLVTKFGDMAFDDQNTRLQGLFDQTPEWVVEGETVEWDEITHTQTPGGLTARDAPAPRIDPLVRKRKSSSLVDFKLESFIPASEVLRERALGDGPEVRERAPAVVARHVKELTRKIALSIEVLASDAMKGTISFDTDRYPFAETLYADVTIPVSTFTKGAAWGTAGTKILSGSAELTTLKRTMRQAIARRLGVIMFNENVGRYFLANTEIQAWLQTTMRGVEFFNTGMLGSGGGMGGVPQWQEYNGYYVNGSATNTFFIPDDRIICLPDDIAEVGMHWARGYGAIPQDRVIGDAVSLLPQRAPQAGFYSYAYSVPNPVGVAIVVGWRGFPVIEKPEGIIYGSI